MTRYRWLWLRNRACAALFALAVLAAFVGVGAVLESLFPDRSRVGLVLLVVIASAMLYGLTQWRWLHGLGDTMLAEERRAYLDERGLTL